MEETNEKTILEKLSKAKRFCDDNDLRIVKEFYRFGFADADAMFRTSFNLMVKGYTHHDEYGKVIDWLTDNKGQSLIITGGCGTGKSVIACSIIPLLFATNERIVRPLTAQQFAQTKMDNRRVWVIDDIGTESNVKSYGNDIDNITTLMDRLDRTGGCVAVITTNLSGEQMRERYGERFMERIIKNFKVVKFTMKSERKYED